LHYGIQTAWTFGIEGAGALLRRSDFGGGNEFFKAWGATDVAEATRLVDICLEAGVNLFDTADVYSQGCRRRFWAGDRRPARQGADIDQGHLPHGRRPERDGLRQAHLVHACEASLKRLGTDYIDIYHLHGFDALTPVEETLDTLNTLVRSGKVRYIACSNFSGWHLMKSLAVADRYGWARYVAHQVYYSVIGRDYEQELMPLGIDQGVGAIIWSPLGWGRLTGKIRAATRCRRRAGCTKLLPMVRRLTTNTVQSHRRLG
jgi:aryl-alcohol dehydrogenase-like predicted oxidoreductase